MSAAMHPRPPPPPPLADDWALFVDVDGCLLEFADHPDAVRVPPRLAGALVALRARLGGALALVSGRSLETLAGFFGAGAGTASGLHGLEQRIDIERIEAPAGPGELASVAADARALARLFPGAVVETKGPNLALHWRAAPRAAAPLASFADAACVRLPGYVVQAGACVVELRPRGCDKGDAIARFMARPPFRGRVPVFVGDDATDEPGFAAVNALGGVSVLVGPARATAARHALRDPAAVHAWLGLDGSP